MSVAIDYTSGAFAANEAQKVGTITGSTLDVSSGQYFDFTPTADTTFAFSNAPASGTAAGFALAVTGANVGSGYDLANASYDSVSFDISSQDGQPTGVVFNSTGTKMYVAGWVNSSIFQYSLSSAFDLSTASYDNVSFSVSSQDSSPFGVSFNNDGTKMYVVGFSSGAVFQYSLSSAFDLSTASYDNVSFSVSSQDSSPFGVSFNLDGSKMYVTGNASNSVFQYSLSSAFDLSTASYDSISFSVSSQDGTPSGISFNLDGSKMYICGASNDSVFQYSLSSAFDLSTASYDSLSFSVSSQDSNPYGMVFNSDGTKMYIVGFSTDVVYQYSTASSPAPATFTYPTSVKWPSGTAPDAPATGETDVLVFYTEDGGTTYQGFQAGDAMA